MVPLAQGLSLAVIKVSARAAVTSRPGRKGSAFKVACVAVGETFAGLRASSVLCLVLFCIILIKYGNWLPSEQGI